MLDNIDREKSVSFLSHFEIMMRFVHQTEPHIFDIFTTRKKILCQVLWLGTRDMVAKGKLLCEARKAFLYVYYVRLLLLLEIGESYQYAKVHLTWILIITSARYTFLLKRNLFIYSTYRRRKKVFNLIKVPFIQFKLELYYSMYL